jgi:ribosomal protein S18 acetylase RimI-like enzyme
MGIEVGARELRLPQDRVALQNLDTSFTSDVIYEVAASIDGFRLTPAVVSPPIRKSFPIDDVDNPRWDSAFVVDDGQIRGFIATALQAWNSRLVIWHFYVSPTHRRKGFGRQLLERALVHGREQGASMAWLETTNLNYPGVQAYLRLGFEPCGLDLTLYNGTGAEGEIALFLARSLS